GAGSRAPVRGRVLIAPGPPRSGVVNPFTLVGAVQPHRVGGRTYRGAPHVRAGVGGGRGRGPGPAGHGGGARGQGAAVPHADRAAGRDGPGRPGTGSSRRGELRPRVAAAPGGGEPGAG